MAATVIDQLVVELGLDPKKFRAAVGGVFDDLRKIRGEGEKTGKGTQESMDKTASSVSKLRGEVLSLFAVFTAGRGIRDFIANTVQMNAGLGRVAVNLDTTAQKLSTWAGAGAQVGASAEDIIGSFQSLTSQAQMFRLTGESSVLPFFRALGVDMFDANGNARDMGNVFLELADKFHQLDPARAKVFGDAMGISPGMINLLHEGRQAVQGMLDTSKKYALTDKDVKAAQELQRSWNMLALSSSAMGRSFLTELAPGLQTAMGWLAKMADWLVENPAILNLVMGTLTGIVALLSLPAAGAFATSIFGGAAAGFGMMAKMLPNLFLGLAVLTETTLPALAARFLATGIAIETALGPIGWAIAALTALAIAGKYAHDNIMAPEEAKSMDDQVTRDIKAQQDAESGEGLPEWLGGKPASKSPSGSPKAPSGGGRATGTAFYSGNHADALAQREADMASLQKMGWTKEQSAGIVSNIARESSGRAGAVGDNGAAFGLAQWHPDRQQDFAAWAGHDIRSATRDEQLAFINHELRFGTHINAGNQLAATKNAYDAGSVVSRAYEAPANGAAEAHLRGQTAENIAGQGSPKAGAAALLSQSQAIPSLTNNQSWSNNTRNSELHIGTLQVNAPQATDAHGIARELPMAMDNLSMAEQANYGPT